jgi:hypothetical protein
MDRDWMKALRVAPLVGALALGGCGTSGEGGGLGGLFSASVATPEPAPLVIAEYCPPVTVIDGAATMQSRSSVISFGQLARECIPNPDGSVTVKVGAEGRVVLGAGGGAGRVDVPIRFVVKEGESVLASRVRRAAVTVSPDQGNAFFAVVEEGIVVPAAAAQSFELEVGLGAGPAVSGRRPRG